MRSAFFARAGCMLSNYLPILIFLVIATALALVLLVLGTGIGRYFARFHDDAAKRAPYECGFDAFEDTRTKFDVRYYLVAILFIVFDLEIAFLFPWAVALAKIGLFGLIAMAIFLGILVVGFIYEWRKGALEWD
jgi:NADH-quinone oxidoreductase subunit A